jgi:RES domain-containing protein
MTPHTGRFYRIVFARNAATVLDGVVTGEGRFHHDGERAIYMSPTPEGAAVAVATYVRPGDPDRLLVPLWLEAAHLADFRDPATVSALELKGGETSITWRDQREIGQPATSWLASDAARASGADGMIYTSRKVPARWHVVLFRWNEPGTPSLREDGPALAFTPRQTF